MAVCVDCSLLRFVKLSVDRAPFLCERLKIHILPTIGLVVDGKTKEFIKGVCCAGGDECMCVLCGRI